MNKTRRNILISGVILVLLAGATLILARLNRPAAMTEGGTLRVIVDGAVLREFTMQELSALPPVEAEKALSDGDGSPSESVYRGPALRTILEEAGADLSGASQVSVRSDDGYVTVFEIAEILESDSILLAYSRDGAGLGDRDSGGTGPYQVIAAQDEFGTRCAKYVCELEAE